ncbi:MAG: glycine--tRNA ligase [Planctomycetaceae bacterium]|nr:glycine--tRNA ligase [Planctomycetaceae bacterium]
MADKANQSNELMDKLVALCKRRGFIFQSSEIYGGIGGFWDYGPLGVELKLNLKAAWWEDIVRRRDDVVGLDCSIIMNPKVWEASGHVGGFADPMVDCKQCKSRFRADSIGFVRLLSDTDEVVMETMTESAADLHGDALIAALAESANSKIRRRITQLQEQNRLKVEGPFVAHQNPEKCKCPRCGGELTEARQFNLMFESHAGAVRDEASKVYLRPETAQGIFVNYKNVMDTSRMKVPFGIAQIGKSFRNEINPRNYTFRSREFEQMEIEFFCHPSEADKWYEYWRDARYQWWVRHGLKSEKLRLRNHEKDELAHYARACADVEYEFPFGICELEGIANRTDFDLTQHQKFSGKDLTYFDDETKERFIPYVIEPSGGVDRGVLAFLCEAYAEDQAPDENGQMQTRVVMRFHPRLAPIKVAVFPLVKKDGMPEIAQEIHAACRNAGLSSFYDEKGAVGRRYRRQDEAGTPLCVTVDGQTLQDGTVTVRDRDSLEQIRIPKDQVAAHVRSVIAKN